MDISTIVANIAPCGLNCGKCLVFEHGEIKGHARALADLLGPNFQAYADRFAMVNPIFGHYKAFRNLLDFLAEGSCRSCRNGQCLFQPCKVRECVKEKGVDFCFQCDSYPCDATGLNERLVRVWRANNDRMKEVGVEQFHEEVKDRPRYP